MTPIDLNNDDARLAELHARLAAGELTPERIRMAAALDPVAVQLCAEAGLGEALEPESWPEEARLRLFVAGARAVEPVYEAENRAMRVRQTDHIQSLLAALDRRALGTESDEAMLAALLLAFEDWAATGLEIIQDPEQWAWMAIVQGACWSLRQNETFRHEVGHRYQDDCGGRQDWELTHLDLRISVSRALETPKPDEAFTPEILAWLYERGDPIRERAEDGSGPV